MLKSSGTGKPARPMLAMCTNAYMRVRVCAAMWRRKAAKLLAPASPAETTVVLAWKGTRSSGAAGDVGDHVRMQADEPRRHQPAARVQHAQRAVRGNVGLQSLHQPKAD